MSKQTSGFPDEELDPKRVGRRPAKGKGEYVLWQWVHYRIFKNKPYWYKVRAYHKLADAEANKKKLERQTWYKHDPKCVILPPGRRPG